MSKFSLLRGFDPSIYQSFIVPVGHYRHIAEDLCRDLNANYISTVDLKELIEHCYYAVCGDFHNMGSSFRHSQAINYLRFCGNDLRTIANDPEVFTLIEESITSTFKNVEDLFRDYICHVVDSNRVEGFQLVGWADPSSIILLRQKDYEPFNF